MSSKNTGSGGGSGSGPTSLSSTSGSGSGSGSGAGATAGTPLVQIGHYVLGETLGIGTFGKVKGESFFGD